MPRTTRSKNKQPPKKNDDITPSTSKLGKNTKQSVKKRPPKTKKTNAAMVPKKERDSEWKINYSENGISSKCALRRLQTIQTYASRRGELRLFGLICDSLNEVERIIGQCTLAPKQTLLTEFFDAAESNGDSYTETG